MTHHNTKLQLGGRKNIYKNIYADTTSKFASIRLLARWSGSVYKLMIHHWLLWFSVYVIISVIYRHVWIHDAKSRQTFELTCIYAEKFSRSLPISFLVGFYVSQVVSRWWQQFNSLPWPDQLALKLANFLPDTDDFHNDLRKTVMRYVNLSSIMVYRLVSRKVMVRFPDYNSLIDAKLILPHEVKMLENIDKKTPHESTWAPLLWAMRLVNKAFTQKKINIESSFVIYNLQASFNEFESANRKVLNYGWVNFPLAYTQVVTFVVYFYFVAALFGRQYLRPYTDGLWPSEWAEKHTYDELNEWINKYSNETEIHYAKDGPLANHSPDFYVPIFTLVEFFCYVGWIKVAQSLLNPFGDDDEDFQMNYMIDRNLQVSYLIVDQACKDVDKLTDLFLNGGIDVLDVPENVMAEKDDSSTGSNSPIISRAAMDNLAGNIRKKISWPVNKASSIIQDMSLSPRPPDEEKENIPTIIIEAAKQTSNSYVNETEKAPE